MEKFIIIAGSPNSGKTISANKTIQKLVADGFVPVHSFASKITPFWTITNAQGDETTVGDVTLEKNGKKVLVISYGDTVGSLNWIFNRVNYGDYYAIVCCSHATRGKQVFNFFHDKIGQINLDKTKVIPIYKNLLSGHINYQKENEHTADLIFELLR